MLISSVKIQSFWPGNNAVFTYLAGSTVATLDPMVCVSAVAAVTKFVSFGITGRTSYLT